MGFSFQGIHSKEKKLKARITGYPMLPAFRNNTESIPGRSGNTGFWNGVFRAYHSGGMFRVPGAGLFCSGT